MRFCTLRCWNWEPTRQLGMKCRGSVGRMLGLDFRGGELTEHHEMSQRTPHHASSLSPDSVTCRGGVQCGSSWLHKCSSTGSVPAKLHMLHCSAAATIPLHCRSRFNSHPPFP